MCVDANRHHLIAFIHRQNGASTVPYFCWYIMHQSILIKHSKYLSFQVDSFGNNFKKVGFVGIRLARVTNYLNLLKLVKLLRPDLDIFVAFEGSV